MANKFESLFSENYQLKIGIMARKVSVLLSMESFA